MKVEVAVRGSPSLISRTLFVDVKHLQRKKWSYRLSAPLSRNRRETR